VLVIVPDFLPLSIAEHPLIILRRPLQARAFLWISPSKDQEAGQQLNQGS
jgi:hypothetical protein